MYHLLYPHLWSPIYDIIKIYGIPIYDIPDMYHLWYPIYGIPFMISP